MGSNPNDRPYFNLKRSSPHEMWYFVCKEHPAVPRESPLVVAVAGEGGLPESAEASVKPG